ncbi:hypothetical protein KAI19_02740 [bacterium]|nr:hypothetical protein [bacterium]
MVIDTYKSGKYYYFTGWDEAYIKLSEKDIKERVGFIKREIQKTPSCIEIGLGETEEDISVVILVNKNKKLVELIENYNKGNGTYIDRMKKYLDIYIVYESLSPKQNIDLKAIRNSFSHSRKNITHKQTVNALMIMFGDVKINFNKRNHNKIFNEKYHKLLNECNKLLAKEIMNKIPKKPNLLDRHYKF